MNHENHRCVLTVGSGAGTVQAVQPVDIVQPWWTPLERRSSDLVDSAAPACITEHHNFNGYYSLSLHFNGHFST